MAYCESDGQLKAQQLLRELFNTVPAINPTKRATDYWLAINRTMLNFSKNVEILWATEKQASAESIEIAKHEDLLFLARQRESIMNLTHDEALVELIRLRNIDSKIQIINRVADNGIFAIK